MNLGAFPYQPGGLAVHKHHGSGTVTLEKRADGQQLYQDGHRVVLTQVEGQKNGKTVKGYVLRDEFTGKSLNANVLDALYEHPELIPDDWKVDEHGDIRCIFFWDTIYQGAHDSLCVRYLYFHGSRWYRHYGCFFLGSDWGGRNWAVVLAS